MTPEDLEEGDGILESMFDTISCPPTHQNRAPSPHLDNEVDVRNKIARFLSYRITFMTYEVS